MLLVGPLLVVRRVDIFTFTAFLGARYAQIYILDVLEAELMPEICMHMAQIIHHWVWYFVYIGDFIMYITKYSRTPQKL
jgi:hypothetical protein